MFVFFIAVTVTVMVLELAATWCKLFPEAAPVSVLESLARDLERSRVRTVVAVDTSASLEPSGPLPSAEAVFARLSSISSVSLLSFAGSVTPFDPSKPVHYWGGTDIVGLVDYVETHHATAERVVVFTDGCSPSSVKYLHPERWEWIIPESGDGSSSSGLRHQVLTRV